MVEQRPDRDNRNNKDIDFVLYCEGQPRIAVEHTSIESFEGQRTFGQIHLQFTEKIVQLLDVPGNTYYKLCCPTEMYEDLEKKDRDALAQTIAEWASHNMKLLKPHGRMNSLQLMNGKYTIWLGQGSNYPPLNGKVLPALMAPKEMDESRKQRIDRALSDKLPKLQPYKQKGMLTFLILEDWDISLSNADLIKNLLLRIKQNYIDQLPYGILQVTSYQNEIIEAWLVKEDAKWSSRISNRGPFYDFKII